MPPKIVKFGIIGYGFMGKTHTANLLRHPNALVTAIYSIPGTTEIPTSVKFYTDSWKSVIDDPEVEVIVIATPTPSHKEIACYAAEKKKHIFVEKPMARTVEDCTKIIEAAQKFGVKLWIGHVLRFWPSYKAAYTATHDKNTSIGNLKMIRTRRLSNFPGWSNWFGDEAQSGGCILDLSIHDIDFATWIMNQSVRGVYCEALRLPELKINAWGLSMTILTFENGSMAYCESSWAGSKSFPFSTECEIIGTEGIIRFDSRMPNPLNIFGDSVISNSPIEEDGYYAEIDAFIQCILNNSPPLVSGEMGRYAVGLCIAAIKSAEEKRIISVKEVLTP
jgi:predicted dehydrogenase